MMRRPITNLGRIWEYSRSLWLFWLVVPYGFLTFVSFWVIGVRGKEMRWIIAGFVYFGLVVLSLFLSQFPDDHFLSDLGVIIVLGQWIAAWVHATAVARPVYLRKRALMEHPELAKKAYWAQSPNMKKAPSKEVKVKKYKNRQQQRKRSASRPPQIININKASRERIAALPGFDNIIAARVLEVRGKVGTFKSMAHFIEAMNLQPHIIAKAKPYIVFSDVDLKKEQSKSKQPPEDKSEGYKRKYSTGRVVDH